MTPWEAAQWVGVVIFALLMLALVVVAFRAAFGKNPPTPVEDETDDEGRTVDL